VSDSAATVIGNFTYVEDANIVKSLAEKIQPDTDIAGEWVTVEVGSLSQDKIEEAFEQRSVEGGLDLRKGMDRRSLDCRTRQSGLDGFFNTVIKQIINSKHAREQSAGINSKTN